MATNEQDIIQRIKTGSIAMPSLTREQESQLLQQDPTIPVASAGPDRVELIRNPAQAFRAGLVSGVANINAQNKNFRATIQTLRGNEIAAENFLREGDRFEAEAARPLQGMETFEQFYEEPTISGFFNQFASATGQFVPSLAASMAEALAVGAVVAGGTIATGGTATPALLAGAGSAILKKQALKQVPKRLAQRKPNVNKEYAENLLNKKYVNTLAERSGKQPRYPLSNAELKDLDDIYAQLRAQKNFGRFKVGAIAGAFSQEQRMGTGIAFSDFADQDMRSPEDALQALAQGQVFGAIGLGAEYATARTIGTRLMRGGKLKTRFNPEDPFDFRLQRQASFKRDLAAGVAVTSVAEGIAEALQEELSVQQKFRIDDDYTQANAKIDRLNALFAGFFGGVGVGGALGGGTGAINKLRELGQIGLAESDGARVFARRDAEVKAGTILKERPDHLLSSFELMADPKSNKDTSYIDIDSKENAMEVLPKLNELLGDGITIPSPTGTVFTNNTGKAQEWANVVDIYPFNTEIQREWLAKNLGYSRAIKPGDDMVVGILDTKYNELAHYQGTSSTTEGDFEAARDAALFIRGEADPNRYKIITQTLAEHQAYRQKGIEDVTSTTPFSVIRSAFQDTSDQNLGEETQEEARSEMRTAEQDDTGDLESDRGAPDVATAAGNIDIRRGVGIRRTDKMAYDQYIQDFYKLPINYDDLVFFVKNTKANSAKASIAKIKRLPKETRQRVANILASINSAADLIGVVDPQTEKVTTVGALTKEDTDYLARVKQNPLVEMSDLLDEIAEQGARIQQEDSISSSIARFEQEGRELKDVPGVGVSEILTETALDIAQEDKDFTRVPIRDVSSVVMKRFGSGTSENPFVDPSRYKQRPAALPVKLRRPTNEKKVAKWEKSLTAQDKKKIKDYEDKLAAHKESVGFMISENDPKATPANIARVRREFVHPTLLQEYDDQSPFLSKGALEMFERRSKEESENTDDVGFVRFVNVFDIAKFRAATKKGEVFKTTPTTKPDARKYKGKKLDKQYIADMKKYENRRFVIVRMTPEKGEFREVTRRNVDEFRNIKQDLQTRTEQAYQRTRGKDYKKNNPIFFKIQNLDPFAKQTTPRDVDISVLLEGITTITKRTNQRTFEELRDGAAQRVAAFIDMLDVLQANNFKIVYYPNTVADSNTLLEMADTQAAQKRLGVTPTREKESAIIGDILDNPDGAGASIMKVRLPKGDASAQITFLRKQFALPRLARDYFTKDAFANVETNFKDLLTDKEFHTLSGILSDYESNMSEMTFNELEELGQRLEDVMTLQYSMPFAGELTGSVRTAKYIKQLKNIQTKPGSEQEASQELFSQLEEQDKAIVKLLSPVRAVLDAIMAQDLRNNPGDLSTIDRPLGAPIGVKEPTVVYKKGVPAVKKAEANGEGINVLRKTGNKHYGNPFTNLKTQTRADVKVNSLKEAVDRYTSWLRGTSDTDLQQERRSWILEQVQNGVLDGKNLLYYSEQTPNHAEALASFVATREGGVIPVNYKQSQVFKGAGQTINKEAKIGTYYQDIATITMERGTAQLDDSGLYALDDVAMGNPVDNTNTKGDIRDRDLFSSYQEQQGQEFRGRDRYADMTRKSETKPTFKNNPKYQKQTYTYIKGMKETLSTTMKARERLLNKKTSTGTGERAKLPFRLKIIEGLTQQARNMGLTTNLKIISAETSLADSQLPAKVRNTIDQEQFDKFRQELLDDPNKAARTLQYEYFDVILMKTEATNITEGAYYNAFLKELGNSLTFQELEKSLKVPAVRKKLLQAYEKTLKEDTVPSNYSNDEDGFINFAADQFGLAIRERLGLNVDGTTYNNLNAPAKAWFKRLAKSQETMYKQLSPAQRKRLEINETFEEYARDMEKKLTDPGTEQIPYKVKASIETVLEGILGKNSPTEKQLIKLMKTSQNILRSKKLPTWMQKVLLTSDTRLRNKGAVGVEIADFLNQEPRTVTETQRAGVLTLKTRRANKMLNDIAKVVGVEDGWWYSSFDANQRAILDEAANDEIATKDLQSKEARQVRDYLEALYSDLGLEKLGVDKREIFFPRVIAIAEIAASDKKLAALKALLKEYNPKVSDNRIDAATKNILAKGAGEVDFNPSDEIDVGMLKERKELFKKVPNKALMDAGVALPAEQAIKQYFDKVSLKYEFEQSGGVKRINSLIKQLPEADQTDVRNIIDSMFGKSKPATGLVRIANNVLLPLNIMTLLAFTVLASLQDTAGPILRSRGTAKISDITSVIKNMIKNPTEAADIAREIGVIGVDAMSSFYVFAGEQTFMNQTAKALSDGWFRVTMLESYTRFTRVFAAGMGTRFLQTHARQAKNGSSDSQKYLAELNVTPDQVLAWEKGKAKKADKLKVEEALAQFVDESIVRPNPAQRPTYANDARFALIWQLKSFFYAYGKTIVFPTLKESHNKFVNEGAGAGAMPLLLMAGILVPITMLGLEIRELTKYFLAELLPGIDGDDPGVNYFRTDSMSTAQYMIEIIDRSGMLGPFTLALPIFLESHRYGQPFFVPPLGPTAERVYDGITWDWRTADYLPVYSQLDTRALGR